jgi:hypothetical protein
MKGRRACSDRPTPKVAEMPDSMSPQLEKALAEAKAVIEAGDSNVAILTAARRIHDIFKLFANRLCVDVRSTTVSLDLILRCVARKTEESLAAIIDLTEHGHAYPATALLRQMCEELLFARYIRSIPAADAQEFLQLKALLEVHEGLKTQEEFFTGEQAKYGWDDPSEAQNVTRAPADIDTKIDVLKERLKDVGRRLSWGKNQTKPSASHMAKRTGSQYIYDFFYHASSSSVHASLHHLARMAWGNAAAGRYSVTNKHLELHYRRFALIYGSSIATEVMEVLRDEYPDAWPREEEEAYSIWLAIIVKPAIVQRAPAIVIKEELRG